MVEQLTLIGVTDFKRSNGWVSRFSGRYSIAKRRITGSGKSLPHNMTGLIWGHIEETNELIESEGKLYSTMIANNGSGI